MNHLLILSGAGVYILLGAAHGVLTIRDTFQPTYFTPTDDSVREAMSEVPIRLHPRTNLWRAWLGFNLSHSLGVIIFGAAVILGTISNHGQILSEPLVQGGILSCAGIYTILAWRFWFWKPLLGSAIATILFAIGFSF